MLVSLAAGVERGAGIPNVINRVGAPLTPARRNRSTKRLDATEERNEHRNHNRSVFVQILRLPDGADADPETGHVGAEYAADVGQSDD